MSSLRGKVRVIRGEAAEDIKFKFELNEFENWEFLGDLAAMRCYILRETSYFDLEEEHVELILLV